MATLAAIRTALAGQLETQFGTGIRVYERWPGNIQVPAVVIWRSTTAYDTTQGGQSNDVTLNVVAYVEVAVPRAGQIQLDQFIAAEGDYSIAAAVNTDGTLGGVVDWATPTEASEDTLINLGGVDYLTAAVTVLVG